MAELLPLERHGYYAGAGVIEALEQEEFQKITSD
jgi:hypothetical protein